MPIHSAFAPRRPQALGSFTHYAIAAVLLCCAVLLRFIIAPVESGFAFITFFPTTALAALIGGLGPGVMVAVGGGLLASSLFFPHSVAEFGPQDWGIVAFYILTEIIICLVIDAMHAANGRYLDLVQELSELRGDAAASPTDKVVPLTVGTVDKGHEVGGPGIHSLKRVPS